MTCFTSMLAMSAPPHLVRGVLTLTLDELTGALLLAALVMPLLNLAGLARCLVAARAVATARTHMGPLADERQLKGQVVSGALGQFSHCYRLPFLGCFLLIAKVYHTVEVVSSDTDYIEMSPSVEITLNTLGDISVCELFSCELRQH